MSYCTKCGNKLNDDALFCDKCGTAVVKNEKTDINTNEVLDGEATGVENADKTNDICESDGNTKNLKNKKIAIIIGACVVVIAIAITSVFLFMHFSKSEETVATDDTTKVEETTEEKEEEKPNKELTEAEILRDEYFNNNLIPLHVLSRDLVRNPNIFKGAYVSADGEVTNILKSEDDGSYLIQVEYPHFDKGATGIVIQGKYKSTDKRIINGDYIFGCGIFDGVDLVSDPNNGSNINAGIIRDFKIAGEDNYFINEYSSDSMKKIISAIFGKNDIDIRAGEKGDNGIEYSFDILNENGLTTKWRFSDIYPYVCVSFDNGENWGNVLFDDNYKNFYVTEIRHNDKMYVIKQCKLSGETIWTRNIEYNADLSASDDDIILFDNRIYVLFDGNLYILKSTSGEDYKKPIMLKGFNTMLKYRESIIIYNDISNDNQGVGDDELLAIDADGNILWRNENKNKCYILGIVQLVNDEVLVPYWSADETKRIYCRINAETGETVNELTIGN